MSVNPEVGKLDIVLNASADKVAQEVDKVNAKLDQMAAKAQSSARSMVSSNESTFGSLQGIASGVQRNASAIDGLGQKTDQLLGKQHTAWLAIGAVVGGQTQSMITKVLGFIDAANAVPGAVEQGFKPIIQSQFLANDALGVTNANIEAQIALIEKKPVNAAAIALAEARVRSDELSSSLDALATKMGSVLSSQHISVFRQLLGKGGTANVESTIGSINDQIADAAAAAQEAIRGGDSQGFATADKHRRDLVAYGRQHTDDMLAQNQDTRFEDNSGNRAMLRSARTVYGNEQDADANRDKNVSDTAQLKKDQDAQREKEAAAAAAAARKAALQQQYRDQMAGFEQLLANMRQGQPAIVGEEELFWERMRATTQRGSLAWLDTNRRVGEEHQKTMRELKEQTQRDAEEFLHASTEGSRAMTGMQQAGQKTSDNRSDAENELYATQVKNAARQQEIAIQLQMGRSITSYDAAVMLASIHTAEYGAEIDRLAAKEKQIQGASYLTSAEKEEQVGKIREDRDTLQSNRGGQMMQDQAAINPPGSSAWIGFEDSLIAITKASKDAATAMESFFSGALSRTNDSIVRAMTLAHGQRTDFGAAGADIARSAAGGLLKSSEGHLLSGLGLGGGKKPTGAAGDPLHVIMAPGTGVPDALKGVISGMKSPDVVSSGAAAVAGAGTSGFMSKLGPMLTSMFIPGFADGGDPQPNSLALVGERGPELVRFGSTRASVIPNHMLGAGSSGDVHNHNYYTDARGSTNAGQTAAMVRQGIMAAAPHIVAAAGKAHNNRNSRLPPSSRS